jgi:hypothetical protein
MYNPLLEDPSKLKDVELEAKILDLGQKYSIAARTGMNQVIPQIITTLEMYKMEQSKRSQIALQTTARKTNGNLDDLINVN